MRKISYYYGTRNDMCYGEMEVPDDTTDKEISEIVKDKLMDYVRYGWEEEK